MVRSSTLAVWLVSGLLLCAACGGGTSGTGGSGDQAAPASQPAAAPADAPGPEPKTVADIFPDGPGKAAVMNNCSSCHNVACSAIGQRTPERWDSLKEGHRERVSGADVDMMFEYLKTHFDSSKPEPRVPPAFLMGGCTPF